jgi:hypothetical protein
MQTVMKYCAVAQPHFQLQAVRRLSRAAAYSLWASRWGPSSSEPHRRPGQKPNPGRGGEGREGQPDECSHRQPARGRPRFVHGPASPTTR